MYVHVYIYITYIYMFIIYICVYHIYMCVCLLYIYIITLENVQGLLPLDVEGKKLMMKLVDI